VPRAGRATPGLGITPPQSDRLAAFRPASSAGTVRAGPDGQPPGGGSSDSRGYELRVPAAIDIQVRDASGDIRLSGVQGSVDLRSDGGAISVQGGSGTARLHTDDGAILAGGLRATDVDASSGSGRIAIQLTVVPRQVVARSRDGDVQVVVPAGPQAYRVDATTTDGKVNTALPTDPDSPVRITASSGSGDVVLRRGG
jgi:hypothetical protein